METSPRRARSGGFTLIEIMAVVLIIGLLGGIVGTVVFSQVDKARVSATRTQVKQLEGILELYRMDNVRYPSTEQGLDALVRKPASGAIPPNWKPYLDKLPSDPWGRPYQFLNPGVKGEIDVFSFGADGQPGGEGKNADVGSWQ